MKKKRKKKRKKGQVLGESSGENPIEIFEILTKLLSYKLNSLIYLFLNSNNPILQSGGVFKTAG